MKQALKKIVFGMALTGALLSGCQKKKPIVDPRPKLTYPDLSGFRDDPLAKASGLISIMYDFKNESLVFLNDLTGDGKIDQMRVESCVPYRGYQLAHIYMSREVSPHSKEDKYFTLVDQSFFDHFNTQL